MMNRAERRAQLAEIRRAPRDMVTAFHEAGHAVVRVVRAAHFGVRAEESILRIEIGPSAGGFFSATTYGPIFPDSMAGIPDSAFSAGFITPTTMALALSMCRDAGLDTERWAAERTLIMMAGPAAEARYTGKPIEVVIESAECVDDKGQAELDCIAAGITPDRLNALLLAGAAEAEALIKAPENWAAVEALAKSLPKIGTMPGRKAVKIVADAIAEHAAR